MLSDSSYWKKRKSSRSRSTSPTAAHRRWSDSQKIECVKTYLMLGGNGALTMATLKIPEQTFYLWKRSEWWHELESEIRREERIELSAKLKKILQSSSDVVADRLENGDWFFNQKTGTLDRKPVAMKDAAKVMADAATLRTRPDVAETFTVAADQIEDKLAKLAKAFEELSSGKKKITNEVVDIDFSESENENGFTDTGDSDDWDEDPGQDYSGPSGESESST